MTPDTSLNCPYWQVARVADTLSYGKWCQGIFRTQFSNITGFSHLLQNFTDVPKTLLVVKFLLEGTQQAHICSYNYEWNPSCQIQPQMGEQHSSLVILLLKHLEMQVIKI